MVHGLIVCTELDFWGQHSDGQHSADLGLQSADLQGHGVSGIEQGVRSQNPEFRRKAISMASSGLSPV